jgi:MtN3 and saliva related transmembrane protein
LGLVVGKLTTLPWLAQLAKARKLLFPHKISFGMLALFSAGLVLCIVCGVIVGDVPVIAANSLTLIFVVLILALKLRYCLT